MTKSLNNIIKVAYERLYKSSQLVGYEVYGRIIRECFFSDDYKIEPVELGHWQKVTSTLHEKEDTNLPVDFTKPKENKIEKGKVKVLEVILNN